MSTLNHLNHIHRLGSFRQFKASGTLSAFSERLYGSAWMPLLILTSLLFFGCSSEKIEKASNDDVIELVLNDFASAGNSLDAVMKGEHTSRQEYTINGKLVPAYSLTDLFDRDMLGSQFVKIQEVKMDEDKIFVALAYSEGYRKQEMADKPVVTKALESVYGTISYTVEVKNMEPPTIITE